LLKVKSRGNQRGQTRQQGEGGSTLLIPQHSEEGATAQSLPDNFKAATPANVTYAAHIKQT